jgi:FkbM family methyltransferase
VTQAHSVRIKVMPIDDIWEIETFDIGFVKIDVQGHELEVPKGAVNTIRKNTPIILFEQESTEFVDHSTPTVDF